MVCYELGARGTSLSSILGEATINLVDYFDASQPAAISLPFIGFDHGTILHVSFQLQTAKTGFRYSFFKMLIRVPIEFEQQRDKGLQSGNNIDKETEPNTARSSSSELEMLDDQEMNTGFSPPRLPAGTLGRYGWASSIYLPMRLDSTEILMQVLERGVLNFEGDSVLVGCVKEFKSLPNIHIACFNEGFSGLKISYLGGFWILLEFDSSQSCEKFKLHEGIKSWFSSLLKWTPNFEIKDRVVWIDIEVDSRGKVSIVRAKEVTGWAPDFSDGNSSISDDVNVKYSEATHNWVDENDVEVVEDSFQRQVNDTAREGNNNVDPYKDNIWAEPWDIVPYLSRDSFLSLSSARGRSGGILCVWDNTLFKKRSVKVTEHCLCVEVVVMGDFNEVRYASERYGSVFHAANAVEFNDFIVNSHLHEIPLGGYSFTWTDKYANKMSKLDRFLVSQGFLDLFPNSENLDDMNKKDSIDLAQKAKVKWAIVGDENSKFFHGIVNKKRRYLAIKGILKDGEWINNPTRVKAEFSHHFSNRFSQPDWTRVPLAEHFPRCLSEDLSCDLEVEVNSDEIKKAVWECGSDKSPGLDDFTFEFFKKYWSIVGNDVILSVKEFFSSGFIPNGCNPSFIAIRSIETKLGAPISQLFVDISPKPMATASLGQVYKGFLVTSSFATHLHTGELVAVKVQRPGMWLSLTLDALLFNMIGGQLKRFAKAGKDIIMAVNETAYTYVWGNSTDIDLYVDWDFEDFEESKLKDYVEMTKDFVKEWEDTTSSHL
ncbi:RNA-directed DNA polymerase, eukaryota [Tanacetum coccineum]